MAFSVLRTQWATLSLRFFICKIRIIMLRCRKISLLLYFFVSLYVIVLLVFIKPNKTVAKLLCINLCGWQHLKYSQWFNFLVFKPCEIPYPDVWAGLTAYFLANRQQQKWQHVTSKIRLQKQDLHPFPASCHMLWRPTWKGTDFFSQQPVVTRGLSTATWVRMEVDC